MGLTDSSQTNEKEIYVIFVHIVYVIKVTYANKYIHNSQICHKSCLDTGCFGEIWRLRIRRQEVVFEKLLWTN